MGFDAADVNAWGSEQMMVMPSYVLRIKEASSGSTLDETFYRRIYSDWVLLDPLSIQRPDLWICA